MAESDDKIFCKTAFSRFYPRAVNECSLSKQVQRDGGGVGDKEKMTSTSIPGVLLGSACQFKQNLNAQSFHLIGELRPTHLQRHFLI